MPMIQNGVCMCVCVFVCVSVCICVCAHAHMYTYYGNHSLKTANSLKATLNKTNIPQSWKPHEGTNQ